MDQWKFLNAVRSSMDVGLSRRSVLIQNFTQSLFKGYRCNLNLVNHASLVMLLVVFFFKRRTSSHENAKNY